MKGTPSNKEYIHEPVLAEPEASGLKRTPMIALAAGAAALITAVTKFMGASVDVRNSRAWSQEVARRAMKDATKS